MWKFVILFFLFTSLFATPLVIKDNMQVAYQPSQKASSLEEFFSKGNLYSRLRLTYIGFDYKRLPSKSALRAGGSFIYKSAFLKGVAGTLGFYSSHVLDKNKMRKHLEGDVVAEAFVEYRRELIDLKAGRQLFESVFTKSNDTKMIPNGFSGYSLEIGPKRLFYKAAYFTSQKLRDRTDYHDVITYGKNGNDDSAANRVFSLTNLSKAHKKGHHSLFVNELKAHLGRWKFLLNYTKVSDLYALAAQEIGYSFKVGRISCAPSFRFVEQFDQGAKDLALPIANLKGDARGYKDPFSVDSKGWNGRVDVRDGFWSLRVAYSKIFDKADFITPWRGFPTGGYTRLMGQYNWYANTSSYLVKAKLRLPSAIHTTLAYAYENYDEKKPAVPSDRGVAYFDIIKRFQGVFAKLRFERVNAKSKPNDKGSYSECRAEISYLF